MSFLIKNRVNRNISKIPSEELFNLEKKELLQYISKSVQHNITNVKQIYVGRKSNFGNQMIIIYKILYYCKILGCKRIILQKDNYHYIKNTIIDKESKMKILVGNIEDIKDFDTIVDRTVNFFFYSNYLRPERNVELLKYEIVKNLPKVSVNINDLYIYIRSGDIFSVSYCRYHNYVQPPFCFYKKVLNEFKFRKIYLIAQNAKNPVIDKLLENFPNIIFKRKALNIDIALLMNANNILSGGWSSFFGQVLLIKNSLKALWLFYLYHQTLKFNNKNYLYNDKFKQFAMYATNDYILNMKPWTNSINQRKYMLNYKCPNNFTIIN